EGPPRPSSRRGRARRLVRPRLARERALGLRRRPARRRHRGHRRHGDRARAAATGARGRALLRLRAAARRGARALRGGDGSRAAASGDAIALVAARAGRRRARARADWRRDPGTFVRFEGFHGRAGLGSRPALVVVDVNRGFTDPASPLVCDLDDVVAAIARLLAAFRSAALPVAFTTVAYDETGKRAAEVFIAKVPALLTLESGSEWVEIDPRVAPAPGEPVFTKLWASAFFGTAFASWLATEGCDSLVVTGASTSGCVRATAV